MTLYVCAGWIFRERYFQLRVSLVVYTCDCTYNFTVFVPCILSDSVIITYDGDELGTATYIASNDGRETLHASPL